VLSHEVFIVTFSPHSSGGGIYSEAKMFNLKAFAERPRCLDQRGVAPGALTVCVELILEPQ
jgi:hypothetical protein